MAWLGPGFRADLGPVVKLVLGVLDVAYSDARGKDGATTTGDVAEILERNYHVMQTFYESRQEKIADWLAGSVANAIETVVETGSNVMPTFEAEQNIEAEFRVFLSANEMSHLLGSLTDSELSYYLGATGGDFRGAGERGVNHRKKRPYSSKNKARPAFIDTGLYQASFRAWVEE
jgi:hypothetical protein